MYGPGMKLGQTVLTNWCVRLMRTNNMIQLCFDLKNLTSAVGLDQGLTLVYNTAPWCANRFFFAP